MIKLFVRSLLILSLIVCSIIFFKRNNGFSKRENGKKFASFEFENKSMISPNEATPSASITDMAYVCLCANKKAIYSTLVLWFQLCSVGAKAPFVALVDANMLEGDESSLMEPLLDSGIKIKTFGAPPFKPTYSVTKGSTKKRDMILWNKLHAWTMTEYKKLIFLDNDLLILDNFDELFAEKELSGVPISFIDEKIVFWNFNNTPIGKKNPLSLHANYF